MISVSRDIRPQSCKDNYDSDLRILYILMYKMYFHLQGRGRASPVLVELDPVQTQIHPSPSKLYKLEMSENNIKKVCSLDGECVLNYTLQILSGKKETIHAHISNWTQVLLLSS